MIRDQGCDNDPENRFRSIMTTDDAVKIYQVADGDRLARTDCRARGVMGTVLNLVDSD